MTSAFGVEHGICWISKAKVPFKHLSPTDQMQTMTGQQARIRRKFARKYPAGEHDVAVGQLRRLSGSRRDFREAEHEHRVQAILPSMRTDGLRHPVEVARYHPMSGGRVEADFHSGGHRLEAARRLGWKRVRTTVLPEEKPRRWSPT